ncbi:MAG: sugar transferase, partial [Acidimicrobiia bacterium]|nr:sugar transferase [Acidimicrobiia bacterium]
LFGHERLGLNGRVFRCWKFRTMRTDADEALRKLLASDPVAAEEWARDHKLSDDPRVTRLGKFLRRFDLDEIPQLINVLNGDMSVVGPRPIVHDEADRFGDRLPVVLSVKPGLTGLWQVSGRNCMSYDDRVVTEAEYASTRTLAGDLRIIVKTPLVLTRSNFGR